MNNQIFVVGKKAYTVGRLEFKNKKGEAKAVHALYECELLPDAADPTRVGSVQQKFGGAKVQAETLLDLHKLLAAAVHALELELQPNGKAKAPEKVMGRAVLG